MGTYGILRTETDWAKVRMLGRVQAIICFSPADELELWTYRYHMRKRRYNVCKDLLWRGILKTQFRNDVREAKKEIQRIHFGF